MNHQKGVFRRFLAKRNFSLSGPKSGTPIMVAEGAEMEFDGLTLRFGDLTLVHPQFRGAINVGWALLVDDA